MQASAEMPPPVGVAREMGNAIRAILAPNPSPMTHWGTNTYLLGTRRLAVIDPGPDDPAHLAAILRALEPGQSISHILVTHAHLDHSPLAARISGETGAPVMAYGDAEAGRSAVMAQLAEAGGIGGGEGVDTDFTPDLLLCDGETVTGDDWQITAHWTPGHFGNHLSFQWGGDVFSGDLVMGWASTLISPPDGDLTQFHASCARLGGLQATRLLPGHGAPVANPAARIDWLRGHRDTRERAILGALTDGPADAHTLAARIYSDTSPALLPAAARNVLAHLLDLMQKSRVTPLHPLRPDCAFSLMSDPETHR
ncbi:MBL fold metallo-hydrolase [Roseovarius autotrophicus]|uniref:MBL fold metallo-hydrolase n=1 Tax=Roseovarius autotrophicus TaxID=2824121 RepID=UPI0019F35A5E|nr:MBL fold metallo-hydrolase [Roseovarius autotrophicus]MBE0455694.1 MBL fold metallo-hydrolase [Roseovarius sp.]